MSEIAEIYGYSQRPIDKDAGVIMRSMGKGRGYVTMYADMPGLYLNPKGGEVDDELARKAGFPIDQDRAEARMRAEIQEAEIEIRAKRDEAEKEIRARLSPGAQQVMSGSPAPRVTDPGPTPFSIPETGLGALITEKNAKGQAQGTEDFVLNHVGGGKWVVAERATKEPRTDTVDRDVATALLVDLQSRLNDDLAGSD